MKKVSNILFWVASGITLVTYILVAIFARNIAAACSQNDAVIRTNAYNARIFCTVAIMLALFFMYMRYLLYANDYLIGASVITGLCLFGFGVGLASAIFLYKQEVINREIRSQIHAEYFRTKNELHSSSKGTADKFFEEYDSIINAFDESEITKEVCFNCLDELKNKVDKCKEDCLNKLSEIEHSLPAQTLLKRNISMYDNLLLKINSFVQENS